MTAVDVLERMKEEDYYDYCHFGFSKLNEEQWDYLIRNFPIWERRIKEETK